LKNNFVSENMYS